MFSHHEHTIKTTSCPALFAQSWIPELAPTGTVLLVHGLTEHSGRYHPVAEFLVTKGFAVYAVDHEGHGRSAGRRGHIKNFQHYLDGVAALRELALTDNSGINAAKPMYIIGHSMGGVITLNYVLQHQDQFQGFALSGAALDTEGVVSTIQKRILHTIAAILPKFGAVKLETGELTHDPEMNISHDCDELILRGTVSAKLISEIIKKAEYGLKKAKNLRIPVLIMHGEADSLASVNGSIKLNTLAGSPDKTLKTYSGMFHEIFLELEREIVFNDLGEWLDRQQPNLRT